MLRLASPVPQPQTALELQHEVEDLLRGEAYARQGHTQVEAAGRRALAATRSPPMDLVVHPNPWASPTSPATPLGHETHSRGLRKHAKIFFLF